MNLDRVKPIPAVTGNHVHRKDRDLGHVTGFLVEESTWALRYLVADTITDSLSIGRKR